MSPGNEHYSSDEDSQESSNGNSSRETLGLIQQLQTLQSLLPDHISLTDERSILENTHDYLQRIHEETEQIQKELSQRSSIYNIPEESSSGHDSGASHRPHIQRVEVEEMMEGRFVVKISWSRRGSGGAGRVQRVIECLNVKMTSTAVKEADPNVMLTTAFIKVIKEDMRMTVEGIHDLVMNEARRSGLVP